MSRNLLDTVLGGGAIEQAASIAHQRRQEALAQEAEASFLDLSQRHAVIAGVKGRLGETLLNHLLASDYAGVTALADRPIQLGLRKLRCCPAAGLAGQPCDDAYLCLNDQEGPFARSWYGRDAHFLEVLQEHLLPLAEHLYRYGVRRLSVLAPLSSWQSMGKVHHGMADETEAALSLLGFDTVQFLRPAVQLTPAPGGSLLQRFAHGYLSLFNMMLPKGAETLRADHLAQATLEAARDPRPGVRVIDNEALLALRARARPAS